MKYSLDSYFALSSLASIAIIAAMIALLIFGITMLLLYMRLRKQSTQTLQASGEQFHALDHNTREMVDSISADMSAERLRLSTELAGVAVWAFDSAESRLSRTPNHDALYGLEQNNDWRIDRFLEATHPDDRERYQQIIYEAVLPDGPDNYSFDFRVIWPDESIHWLANTGEVSKRDEDGVGVLIRGCLIDITERKQAEDALLESEKRYRLIYDNSLDAILLTAPDGRVLSANAAATEMFQMTEEEICQAGRRGLVDSEDTRLNGYLEERASTQKVFGELNLLRKDGTKFPAEVSSAIFTNRYGEERTSMIIRDVSERKGAEERLIASEKRFRALFEQSGDYCLILDPNTVDGIPIIVDASQTAWAMHGYAREEFIGRPVADIDDYEGKQLVVERTKRIMTGNPFFIETTHVRKDGSTFPVSVHANRIDIEGEPPLIFTTEFDITKRKLAEESLGKSEERLRLATEMAGVAVWETDFQTRQTTRSANHDQLYGLEPQDVWNFETFLSYVHPDDREQTIRNIQQSIEPDAPNPSTFDLRVVWPDESVHWLSIRGEVIARDENGYGTKVRGCTIDFTKRREAEEALILSEERLRLSTEIGGVAVWEFDMATGEITRSSNYEQLYGLEPQETWNLETLLSSIYPDDREDILRKIQESAKPGSPDQGSYDFRVVWPDGSLHWLAIRGEVSERDEHGVGTLIRGCVLDITERKQAEEALQSSESRLIDAQRIAEMGDFVWDFKTGKITWSDALYELLKYDKSEEINYAKVNQDIFHPDDRKRVSQWLNGSIASGEPELTPTEYRIIRKDGAVRHVRVQGVIRRDEENAIKIFATVQDITERVEAEKALRESEERLRLSTELGGVAVWEYHFAEDRMIRTDNHDRLYGVEPQDSWGFEDFLAHIHPDDQERASQVIQEAVGPGGSGFSSFDYRVIWPDGTLHWLALIGEVTERDENGIGAVVRGCLIDITQRKLAEEALRLKEANLLEAQEIALLGNWEMDASTGYIAWSDKVYEYFGIEKPEAGLALETFMGFVHPDDQATLYALVESVSTNPNVQFEYRFIRPDGEMRWFAGRGKTEFDEVGAPVRMFGILQDITERKLAEEALRLSEASLREAQEIANLGNWELDVATTLITWSNVNDRIFGIELPADGITFNTFINLIHPEDQESIYQFRDALATDGSVHVEYRAVRPDGEIRWIAAEGKTTLDESGSPVRMYGVLQDITERKLADEALRTSEEKFRGLYEQSPVAIQIYDETGALIDANQQTLELFGVDDISNLLGYDMWSSPNYTPETIDAVRSGQSVYIEATLDFESVKETNLFPTDKTGMLHLDLYVFPLMWEERITGYIVELVDITARKEAAAAIAQSEERFRGLYEQSPIAVQIYNKEGLLVDVNQQTLELFGINSVNYILGFNMWTDPNLTPDAIETLKNGKPVALAGMLDFDIVKAAELFPTTKSGIMHVDMHVTPLTLNDEIAGYLVQMVDETERQKAAEAIALSEEKFRNLFEQSQVAIQLYDTDGKLVDLNQRTEEIFGIESKEELFGFDMWAALNIAPEAIANLRGGQSANIEYIFDYEMVKDAGLYPTDRSGILYLDIYLSPIMRNNDITNYLVQVIDITERKQMEERLLQAQKMESIGRLAGGIAHDFNNILVPIMGYVDLGIRIMDPAEDFFPYLQRIRQAADRAAGLTRQILAFSRQQVLEMQVLDLNQVVTNFETFIKRLIGEDVVLQTFLDPELYQVNADSGQIEQVLMNLAINARDAMPSGGNLTIETANVYLGADYVTKYAGSQPPGHYVMVAISDTGHGMDEETQQQIFDPFFTTKSQGEGTGLGLSTVFGIIKQHGGNIWVYSELEKGATFKIYLPRIEGETLLSDDTPRLSNPVGGMETVLVVEDEEMVRQLVCETLAAYGYHVLEAQSPSDALRIVGERSDVIHLLLTDVIMPEMNGKELYQKIAAIDPHIKVLYMSGYTDNVIVHHGMLDKGVNFLQKPFTIQDLTEKIKQVLNADKA